MNRASPIPTMTPEQRLQQFQQQNGLGQYAPPVRDVTFQSQPERQQGVPGYAAGGSVGNVMGITGGQFSPQSPNFGSPRPATMGLGSQPAQYSPWQQQGGGIGGSTPFLSGIQQQLGGMFGQTQGLGFRPQQAPASQAMPQMRPSQAYSQVSGGSMTPMTPWMTQQIQGSPYRNQMTTAGNGMTARGAR